MSAALTKHDEANLDADSIFVEELNANDGEPIRLNNMSTSQTVQHLKRATAEKIGQPSKWSEITFVFLGQELSNLDRTLASYGIEDGDCLFFSRSITPQLRRHNNSGAPPPYTTNGEPTLKNLSFKGSSGETYNLTHLPLSMTVATLKKTLAESRGLSQQDLRFIWGGKQLEDNLKLETYGLQENSTIHIVKRVHGGDR